MAYSSLMIGSEQQRRDFYVRFNSRVLAHLAFDESEGEFLYDHFCRYRRHWRLRPGIDYLLKTLRKRGFRLVLASNFDVLLGKTLIMNGDADKFDALFVSGNLGVEKPELAFYRYICDSLSLPAKKIVMVGDDLGLDVIPALEIGMKAIHLRQNNYIPRNESNQAAAEYIEITTLVNLLELFKAADTQP
jgi:HAD superfamily hydrolase (TIGR01549 family)